eukprot:6867170-Heterocapsa_arctica.AAC.1
MLQTGRSFRRKLPCVEDADDVENAEDVEDEEADSVVPIFVFLAIRSLLPGAVRFWAIKMFLAMFQ